MTNTELKKHCAKITLNPFASASYSLGTISFVMIALLLVQVAMLAVSKSFDSLVVLLFALLASVCAEAAFYFFKRTEQRFYSDSERNRRCRECEQSRKKNKHYNS